MLDNKVLVNLHILSLGKDYEVYLPVNEKIGVISRLLNSTMFDSSNNNKSFVLFNADTGVTYENNILVRNTDIKNGSRLILL